MLLRFSVENYLSIKDEISLEMTPLKSRLMKDHIINDDKGKKTSVLPVAAIYGANASGKSNLVKALAFIKRLVTHGTKLKRTTGCMPFRLNSKSREEPSRFELVFKKEGVLYTYGVVVSADEVHEEWLFANFTAYESKLFERITTNGTTQVVPGNKLAQTDKEKLFIEFIAKGTRPNQLFLTEANDKNVDLLKPVLNWFFDNLILIEPDSEYTALEIRAYKDHEFLNHLGRVLKHADFGIEDIYCESEAFDPEKHLPNIPVSSKEEIIDELHGDKFGVFLIQGTAGAIALLKENKGEEGAEIQAIKIKTHHICDDGTDVYFDTSLESDGTRRLMHLAPMLMDVEEKERVFVIDELDRSLHTHLSRSIIASFIDSISSGNAKGQLILTTHDTNLLDRSLLRKDEIWFMEKCKDNASHLSSLAEYKISDGLNYENGYLNGRFGAIPFLGDARALLR